MQIKADFTRKELMEKRDVLFEACHPIEKLRAVARLLYAYPDGPWDIDKNVIQTTSDMIEDAVKEIEFLIEISNEQWRTNHE